MMIQPRGRSFWWVFSRIEWGLCPFGSLIVFITHAAHLYNSDSHDMIEYQIQYRTTPDRSREKRKEMGKMKNGNPRSEEESSEASAFCFDESGTMNRELVAVHDISYLQS